MKKYQFNPSPSMGRHIVLDTETTGLSPKLGDRICELAAHELVDGRLTGRVYQSYFNPECAVDPMAEAVHGLSNAFLSNKPRFAQQLPKFQEFLGDLTGVTIWAHNAAFDARFIDHEYSLMCLPLLPRFTCSLKLAKAVLGKGDNKLPTLAARANVRYSGRGAHSASSDTEVLSHVLVKLLWPREAALAGAAISDSLAVVKAAPEPLKSRKVQSAPGPAKHVVPMDDERIRRYDDMSLEGLLTSKGKRWTSEEEAELVHSFAVHKRQVSDLVQAHGRSPAALFLKLSALGVINAAHPYAL